MATIKLPPSGGDGMLPIKSPTPGNDRLEGTEFNDFINALSGNDFVRGNGGNDTIHGNAGKDELYGNDGDDQLYGDEGDDQLYGGAGKDLLDGGTGSDRMEGGAGNDVYVVDNVCDVVVEKSGAGAGDADTVNAFINYTLTANVENLNLLGSNALRGRGNELANVLVGNEGNNVLDGLGGNDTLHGGAGADQLNGGAGEDKLYGDDGFDTLDGGEGNDQLFGGNDNDALNGGKGNDLLYGGNGADLLSGDQGNDLLSGGEGNDILFGGAGQDKLYGNGGFDFLTGGGDADTFYFDMPVGGLVETDTILDFKVAGSGADRIDLTAIAGALGGELFWNGSTPLSHGVWATQQTIQGQTFTTIQVDTGGDLQPEMMIKLTGQMVAPLDINDFNGLKTAPPPHTAPLAADSSISSLNRLAHVFSAADFHLEANDVDGDLITGVSVSQIEQAGQGKLYYEGASLSGTQSVTRADLDAGKLVYYRAGVDADEGEGRFSFTIHDDGPAGNNASAAKIMQMSLLTDERLFAVNNGGDAKLVSAHFRDFDVSEPYTVIFDVNADHLIGQGDLVYIGAGPQAQQTSEGFRTVAVSFSYEILDPITAVNLYVPGVAANVSTASGYKLDIFDIPDDRENFSVQKDGFYYIAEDNFASSSDGYRYGSETDFFPAPFDSVYYYIGGSGFSNSTGDQPFLDVQFYA